MFVLDDGTTEHQLPNPELNNVLRHPDEIVVKVTEALSLYTVVTPANNEQVFSFELTENQVETLISYIDCSKVYTVTWESNTFTCKIKKDSLRFTNKGRGKKCDSDEIYTCSLVLINETVP